MLQRKIAVNSKCAVCMQALLQFFTLLLVDFRISYIGLPSHNQWPTIVFPVAEQRDQNPEGQRSPNSYYETFEDHLM